MTRPLNLSDHVREFEYVTRAVGECLNDFLAARDGHPVHYNVDFGLLCPLLFNKPGPGSKEFLMAAVPYTRRALDLGSGSDSFRFVVSGPTIIEFFDQLDHMLRGARHAALTIPRRYTDVDEGTLRDQLLTSGALREDLTRLTRRGIDANLRKPVRRLLEWLDAGSIVGIGDVVDVEAVRAATDKALFSRMFEQQRSTRLSDSRRRPEDSAFHLRVDAANNCLTIAAAKTEPTPMYFVTPTPLNIQQCTIDGQAYGRLDKTPVFFANLEDMLARGTIDDGERFLNLAAAEGVELIDDMHRYASLTECPPHLQMRMMGFYRRYVGPLAATDRVDSQPSPAELDELAGLIRDPQRLRDVVEEAGDAARDGVAALQAYGDSLGLSYIDEFDFSDDPVLRRLRKNLGLHRE